MVEPKIIGHLNAATRIYQAAADEQLVREASSVDGYRGYLMRAFGFEKGLERALARVDPFDGNLHARSKSPVIADDLFALWLTPDEVFALPVCDAAEHVETIADALGCCSFPSASRSRTGWSSTSSIRRLGRRQRRTSISCCHDRHGSRSCASSMFRREVLRVITSASIAFRAQRAWFATSAPKLQRVKSDA